MLDTATAQRIAVRFAGDGAGVEELTWGQRAAWGSMRINGEADWAGGTMPLRDGQTVDELAALLARVMSRHQSLRTRFVPDADGEPRQSLADGGEVCLEVVEAGDRDPETVAEAVRERLETAPFDPAEDWSVRWAVICRDGVASWFVALYTHLVLDGYGIEALTADLTDPPDEVPGVPPFEQARRQRGATARRQQAASLRHWEQHLRTIPPERFPPVAAPAEPRWWDVSYDSPATYLALHEVAAGTKVHSGTVLLAAYAVALARISGDSRTVLRTLVSNRFRPGFRETVAPVAQSALCVIDTSGETFDEVVATAFQSQLSAGLHAYYDPRELWAMIDRVGTERGAAIDVSSYFSDRRRSFATFPDGMTVTPDDVTRALDRGRLRWGRRSDSPDTTCFLLVNPVPDTIDLTIRADTHRLSPDDMAGCLRAMEEIVVAAAFPAATT
ncbi:condensation domain-containing protein [Dactylosporangium sp. NPDC005572]|uniref:condensation domain-containing protein n=1 Tax=Dactylosporangium sp. NPDC005572 TaxID=3156889 RepID=UPI0033B95B53